MQELLSSLASNATNPAVLFFLIGLAASLLRVELPIPGGFKAVVTVYLMAAIGLKGGTALSQVGLANVWLPAVGVALLSAVTPLWVYPLARYGVRLNFADAIAMSAHYGSVSAITFASAVNYLNGAGITYEGAAPAFLAIMEVPGIVVALSLYQWLSARKEGAENSIGAALGQVLRGKSVFVLLASLIAGYLMGKPGMAALEGFFVTPFQGVLTLFLLEMGMEAGGRLHDLRRIGPRLLIFGIGLALVQGALGTAAGIILGLSVGGAALVGTLAASASYIAAPAAVRVVIPEANPSVYVTSSLGITFPFNVVIGIPLYLTLAQYLAQ